MTDTAVKATERNLHPWIDLGQPNRIPVLAQVLGPGAGGGVCEAYPPGSNSI